MSKSPTAIAMLFWMGGALAQGGEAVYPSDPCAHPDGVLAGGEGLARLDPATGERQWRSLTGKRTYEPVCAGEVVLIGSRDGLHAVEADGGEPLWSHGDGSSIYSPVVTGGHAYAAGRDGTLRKVEAATGQLLWERSLEGWLFPPAVAGNRVVVGGRAREVTALDPRTGSIEWTRSIDQELVYRPATGPRGRLVVATTYAPSVLAFRAEDGTLLWRIEPQALTYTPLIDRRRVYLGDRDGRVTARSLTDGRLLWEARLNGVIRSIPRADPVRPDLMWVGVERGLDEGQIAALYRATGQVRWRKGAPGRVVDPPLPGARQVFVQTGDAGIWVPSLPDRLVRDPSRTGRVEPEGAEAPLALGAFRRTSTIPSGKGGEP